jgi:hypothetical protein
MTLTVTNLIVWSQIVTHGAILLSDTAQLAPQFDFITRADGTASDKNNLLPLELCYAAITGIAFGTVGAAYLFAALGQGPIKFAAMISIFTHATWLFHLAWRWDVWNEMMHPDGSMSPTFFAMTHLGFLVLSAYLLAHIAFVEPKKTKAT